MHLILCFLLLGLGMLAEASPSHAVKINFSQRSSDWQIPEKVFLKTHDGIAVRLDEQSINIDLQQKLNDLSGISIQGNNNSGNEFSLSLHLRGKDGTKLLIPMRWPGGQKQVSLKLPEILTKQTVERLEISGNGLLQINSLHLLTKHAPPPRLLISAKRLCWADDKAANGVICEIRNPLKVELANRGDAQIDFKLRLEPIAAPDEESEMPLIPLQATGRNEVEVMIPDETGIGAYELSISAPEMATPLSSRIYLVESEQHQAMERQARTAALYGEYGEWQIIEKNSRASRVFDYGAIDKKILSQGKAILYETDLSPAWLMDLRTSQIELFQGLSQNGRGQPSFFAYAAEGQISVRTATGVIDLKEMSEPWILFWFSSAQGWEDGDLPIMINLQHRAQRLEFMPDAVRLDFDGNCGFLAFMPLFGIFRPPQNENERMADTESFPELDIQSWNWHPALPESVIARCRWWSRALMHYPIDCTEEFNVNPETDKITVRQFFDYLEINDDWGSEPLLFAPVSPGLAFTQLPDGKFPIRFLRRQPADLEMMTPFGPYMGVVGIDRIEYEVTGMLDIINREELQLPPDMSVPGINQAIKTLRKVLQEKFSSIPDPENPAAAVLNPKERDSDWCWPKTLAYADERSRARAKAIMINYYRRQIAEIPAFSLWSYAHYSGDRQLITRNWKTIYSSMDNPGNMDWKVIGQKQKNEFGELLPPMLAMARMAYIAGDIDSYYFFCYCFMREAITIYAKERNVGTNYFRARQPFATRKQMPEWALPTHIADKLAGWSLDTENYRPWFPEHCYSANRWNGMSSEACGILFRKYWRDWTETELAAIRTGKLEIPCAPATEKNAAGIPSQLRLFSYLLDPPAEYLAQEFPPETWNWEKAGQSSGTAASAYAFIRTAMSRKRQLLIPQHIPSSGFVPGIERLPLVNKEKGLVLYDYSYENMAEWPQPACFGRGRTPSPNQGSDYFLKLGKIRPAGAGKPKSTETQQINWVSRLRIFK